MPSKYKQSPKDRATHMVFDQLVYDDASSRHVVICKTVPKHSIVTETLRRVEQAEVDHFFAAELDRPTTR